MFCRVCAVAAFLHRGFWEVTRGLTQGPGPGSLSEVCVRGPWVSEAPWICRPAVPAAEAPRAGFLGTALSHLNMWFVVFVVV